MKSFEWNNLVSEIIFCLTKLAKGHFTPDHVWVCNHHKMENNVFWTCQVKSSRYILLCQRRDYFFQINSCEQDLSLESTEFGNWLGNSNMMSAESQNQISATFKPKGIVCGAQNSIKIHSMY